MQSLAVKYKPVGGHLSGFFIKSFNNFREFLINVLGVLMEFWMNSGTYGTV